MHKLSTSFILGYHGCSSEVAESVLQGDDFRPSTNVYDWLGSGVYFWEANPKRGLEYYREMQARKKKSHEDEAVVGAVIDLGYCLDLTTSSAIQLVQASYSGLVETIEKSAKTLPANRGGDDRLKRELDCAVINYLNGLLKEAKEPQFDTVRGIFLEGKEIYPGAGFLEKTHIQIAVRNLDCIKGVFRVKASELK